MRFLGEKEDCPTDQLLVYLVRVQLILNKVIAAASTDNYLCGEAGQRLPQDLYMQMFKSQLEELRMSIPPDLQSNGTYPLVSVCLTNRLTLDRNIKATHPECIRLHSRA